MFKNQEEDGEEEELEISSEPQAWGWIIGMMLLMGGASHVLVEVHLGDLAGIDAVLLGFVVIARNFSPGYRSFSDQRKDNMMQPFQTCSEATFLTSAFVSVFNPDCTGHGRRSNPIVLPQIELIRAWLRNFSSILLFRSGYEPANQVVIAIGICFDRDSLHFLNVKTESLSQLLSFLDASPTPFHAVDALQNRLNAFGFEELLNRNPGKFFRDRNISWFAVFAIAAWIREQDLSVTGFRLIGAHAMVPISGSNLSDLNQHGYLQFGASLWGCPAFKLGWPDLSLAGMIYLKNKTGKTKAIFFIIANHFWDSFTRNPPQPGC